MSDTDNELRVQALNADIQSGGRLRYGEVYEFLSEQWNLAVVSTLTSAQERDILYDQDSEPPAG